MSIKITKSGFTASDGDVRYLKLDQSTPQTLTTSPKFNNLTATRVPFVSATKTITDNTGFSFDSANGILSVPGKVQVNTDTSNWQTAVIGITNVNTQGQNGVIQRINNRNLATWRTDYVGGISWAAGTTTTGYTGYHDFYTNGDYPNGKKLLTLRSQANSNGTTDHNYGSVGLLMSGGMDNPLTSFDLEHRLFYDDSTEKIAFFPGGQTDRTTVLGYMNETFNIYGSGKFAYESYAPTDLGTSIFQAGYGGYGYELGTTIYYRMYYYNADRRFNASYDSANITIVDYDFDPVLIDTQATNAVGVIIRRSLDGGLTYPDYRDIALEDGFMETEDDDTGWTTGTPTVTPTGDTVSSALLNYTDGNGIINALYSSQPLQLVPQANPPATASEGMIYADTDHHLYYYNGTSWKQLDN